MGEELGNYVHQNTHRQTVTYGGGASPGRVLGLTDRNIHVKMYTKKTFKT